MPDPFDASRMRTEFNEPSDSRQQTEARNQFLHAIQLGRHHQPDNGYPPDVVACVEKLWAIASSNSPISKLMAIVDFLLELNAYSLEVQIAKSSDAVRARDLQLGTLAQLRSIEELDMEVTTHRRLRGVAAGPATAATLSIGEALACWAEDRTEAGQGGARAFHLLVENVCTYLFSPALVEPKVESPRHGGIKVVDIAYINVADSGFFAWLRSTINCMFVWVEVKNYGADPVNPEVDQLAGRLNRAAGMFGILVTRKIKNRKRTDQRASRLFTDGKWVVVLDLDDLRVIAQQRKREGTQFPHLRRRMRDVVGHW